MSVGSTHEAPALKLHLFTWSVKSDSCYNVLWLCSAQTLGAADHALAQVRPRQKKIYWGGGGGGGVVRLTAKPRYLLLLHRGNEKSNTVTALVSPAILKPFYSGAIESVLTQCISVWYNNATNQDCKALQRVVRLAERISGSTLPSLQDIYLKRCKSRAAKIIKDSNHPGNHNFCLLPSGKRFRSMMAKTERLRRSFFPQAIRLLNSVS